MADHIPFVNTASDLAIVKRFYSDSEFVRMPLDYAEQAGTPPSGRLWVDGAVEAFEDWKPVPGTQAPWRALAKELSEYQHVVAVAEGEKPDAKRVARFAASVLDRCAALQPAWISVPQLGYANDSRRNAINRVLAEATSTWRSKSKFKGKLILPVVLRHQDQGNTKTERNKKVQLAASCSDLSGADGYWIVESSLGDQTGSGTFDRKRFPGVISFHRELGNKIGKPDVISVGGPYWALNLILWARGLIKHPAIGTGVGYQYLIRSVVPRKGTTRVALSPLRRTAQASRELSQWLGNLPSDNAYAPLRELRRELPRLMQVDGAARSQVARFYKIWFDAIAAAKPDGRALALYQDFSSAYVLGKAIKDDLPAAEGAARRPERVAEQMMMQCLSR
jgi:hypothetical protein